MMWFEEMVREGRVFALKNAPWLSFFHSFILIPIDSPRNVRATFVTKGFWQSSEKRTVCNKCKPILLTDGKPL